MLPIDPGGQITGSLIPCWTHRTGSQNHNPAKDHEFEKLACLLNSLSDSSKSEATWLHSTMEMFEIEKKKSSKVS